MISLIGCVKIAGRDHSPNPLPILEPCLEVSFLVPYQTTMEGMIKFDTSYVESDFEQLYFKIHFHCCFNNFAPDYWGGLPVQSGLLHIFRSPICYGNDILLLLLPFPCSRQVYNIILIIFLILNVFSPSYGECQHALAELGD